MPISLVLLIFAVRNGTPLRYADEREYFDLASSIYEHHEYALGGAPTGFRPPAWPCVLAVFLALGIPSHLLSLVPVGALVMASLVAACLGVRICKSSYGVICGIAVLVYPINIYTAGTLYPQAFATLLILTIWLFSYNLVDASSNERRFPALNSVCLGGASALLTLSVPTLAFTALAAIIWTAFSIKGDRMRATYLALASYLTPIGIWAYWNYRTIGVPVLISTSGGYNLLIGNNSTAKGSSGVAVDISRYINAAAPLNEVERDRLYTREAVAWITKNPGQSADLYMQKLINYFAPYNAPVTSSEGSKEKLFIAWTAFGLLILLALTRIALRKYLEMARTEIFFLSVFLLNAPVMAIFFTRPRFRQPLDNILLVEAGIGLLIVATQITRSRSLPTLRKIRGTQ